MNGEDCGAHEDDRRDDHRGGGAERGRDDAHRAPEDIDHARDQHRRQRRSVPGPPGVVAGHRDARPDVGEVVPAELPGRSSPRQPHHEDRSADLDGECGHHCSVDSFVSYGSIGFSRGTEIDDVHAANVYAKDDPLAPVGQWLGVPAREG